MHWDNPAASGGLFAGVLSVLLSISYFSLISVVAYLALATLAGVAAIKLYSFVMVFLKKVRNSFLTSLLLLFLSLLTETA